MGLRVDLTAGRVTREALNQEWARSFIGGRGVAARYFDDEVDPLVDPFSPENKLIFATGPLTGTGAATGGRYSVITKGALTNAIACSNAGGYFGAELKLAGWDMVLFTGKSPAPVYLWIADDRAELIAAEGFVWGKSVWDTEALLTMRLSARCACLCSSPRRSRKTHSSTVPWSMRVKPIDSMMLFS